MRGVVRWAGSESVARGSATIWVLALATALWTIAVGAMLVGQARVARHRAGAVADLAALAGAGHMFDGTPCKPAASVARVNGGNLVACEVSGETVDVVVEVPLGRLGTLVGEHAVRARARAGPGPYGAGGPRGQGRKDAAHAIMPAETGR